MKNLILLLIIAVFCLFTTAPIPAGDLATASFSWLPNTEADLAGYRIYYGTTPGGPYPNMIEIGKPAPIDGRIHGSVPNLTPGTTYYFVAVARNLGGLESDYSSEAVFTPTTSESPPSPPSGLRILQFGN